MGIASSGGVDAPACCIEMQRRAGEPPQKGQENARQDEGKEAVPDPFQRGKSEVSVGKSYRKHGVHNRGRQNERKLANQNDGCE